MTIASSQPTRVERAVSFVQGQAKDTSLSVLRFNFQKRSNPEQRQKLISQLNGLVDEPRKIKNLLTTSRGKEDTKAFELLEEMIQSGDTEISGKTLKIFTQYLEVSSTRQNAMGDTIDQNGATKHEAAFTELTHFLNTSDPGKKNRHALNIANSCGFLYREEGDDRQSTSWRRGPIDPHAAAGTDNRLFDFFHGLKTTTSGKMLHRLATDSGLHEAHQSLASAHLEGTETGLSNEVKASISQQSGIKAYAFNPLGIWGDKSLTSKVSAESPGEVEFLKEFKKGAEFNFSIAGLEKKFIEAKDLDERKAVVLDFVTAFELLSFRKAALLEEGKGLIDLVVADKAKAIEKQQKQMMEALQQSSGRNPEVAAAVQDLFKKNGTSIFMFHMKGAVSTTEKAVSALVAREIKELQADYGTDSTLLESGAPIRDSYRDLARLQKETERKVETLSVELAQDALTEIDKPQLLNQKAIADFERFVGYTFSGDVTDSSKANATDQDRWKKIKKSSPSSQFFGSDRAAQEIKHQIETSADPHIAYVRDNFERIYGIDLNTMLTRAQEQERIFKTDEDSYIFDRPGKLTEELTKVAQAARAKHEANPSGFELSHAVTKPGFETKIKKIADGDMSLTQERIIAEIINADNKAYVDAGFDEGEPGHLERLLRAPNSERPQVQASERILGVLELERRIIKSSNSAGDKAAAIEYIHHNLLGDSSFTVTDLSTYGEQLNQALGKKKTGYRSVIGQSSPEKFSQLLKARYKLDDLTISNGKAAHSVMKFMQRETELLAKGFNGHMPEGLFFNSTDTVLSTLDNLRTKIDAAREAGSMEEESEALVEMLGEFRAIGMPVDSLIQADSLNDGSWKDEFILADPLFLNTNGQQLDIIELFVQIWNSILSKMDVKS